MLVELVHHVRSQYWPLVGACEKFWRIEAARSYDGQLSLPPESDHAIACYADEHGYMPMHVASSALSRAATGCECEVRKWAVTPSRHKFEAETTASLLIHHCLFALERELIETAGWNGSAAAIRQICDALAEAQCKLERLLELSIVERRKGDYPSRYHELERSLHDTLAPHAAKLPLVIGSGIAAAGREIDRLTAVALDGVVLPERFIAAAVFIQLRDHMLSQIEQMRCYRYAAPRARIVHLASNRAPGEAVPAARLTS